MGGSATTNRVSMSLLEKEAKDQAEEIHDKKREISPLYSRERIKKNSFLLAIKAYSIILFSTSKELS